MSSNLSMHSDPDQVPVRPHSSRFRGGDLTSSRCSRWPRACQTPPGRSPRSARPRSSPGSTPWPRAAPGPARCAAQCPALWTAQQGHRSQVRGADWRSFQFTMLLRDQVCVCVCVWGGGFTSSDLKACLRWVYFRNLQGCQEGVEDQDVCVCVFVCVSESAWGFMSMSRHLCVYEQLLFVCNYK